MQRNDPFFTLTLFLPILILTILTPVGLALPGYNNLYLNMNKTFILSHSTFYWKRENLRKWALVYVYHLIINSHVTSELNPPPSRYELVLYNQWVGFLGSGTKWGQSDMLRWFLTALNLWPNAQILISGCHFRWRELLKVNFRFERIPPKTAEIWPRYGPATCR